MREERWVGGRGWGWGCYEWHLGMERGFFLVEKSVVFFETGSGFS